ncbi:MAG: hypothetical protein J6Y78_17775 [Paludibacteraceae bacterium]|nr:hypothetical protein [Paludibacteraceae bacterium]
MLGELVVTPSISGSLSYGKSDAVLKTKTITENGIYNAHDDEADGFSSVTVNCPSGITYEKLCDVQYVGNDTEQIPVMYSLTKGTNFDEFISYSSDTRKFTVLKDFDAFIVPYVYQYSTPSGSYAYGSLYINDTEEVIFHVPYRRAGSVAGYPVVRHMTANETFYNYTPYSDGYPQQMLKLYKMNGASASDITTFQNMLEMVAPTE